MRDEHVRCVDAWLGRHAPHSSLEALEALESGLGAIWSRASVAISEVALATILGSVLHKARKRWAPFSAITVSLHGAHVDRSRVEGVAFHELVAGVRYVLIEFLELIGVLNTDVLSAALHDELSYVRRISGHTTKQRPSRRVS